MGIFNNKYLNKRGDYNFQEQMNPRRLFTGRFKTNVPGDQYNENEEGDAAANAMQDDTNNDPSAVVDPPIQPGAPKTTASSPIGANNDNSDDGSEESGSAASVVKPKGLGLSAASGLQPPTPPHSSVLGTILSLALPALVSAKYHQGIIPGLAIGLGNIGKQKSNLYKEQLDEYNKQVQQADTQQREKAQEDYQQGMLKIGQQNADTNESKADKNGGLTPAAKGKADDANQTAVDLFGNLDDAQKTWDSINGRVDKSQLTGTGRIGGTIASMFAKANSQDPNAADYSTIDNLSNFISANAAKTSLSRVTQNEWNTFMKALKDPTMSPAEKKNAIDVFKQHALDKINESNRLEGLPEISEDQITKQLKKRQKVGGGGPGGGADVHARAIQWAKDNPNDPRSAAILKANGVQ